jgi:hypothetical protein
MRLPIPARSGEASIPDLENTVQDANIGVRAAGCSRRLEPRGLEWRSPRSTPRSLDSVSKAFRLVLCLVLPE